MLADIGVEQRSGVLIVGVTGEIDLSNVHEVHTAVMDAASVGPAPVLLNLSGTRYLDSAGVRMLFELAAHFTAAQRSIRLIVPQKTPIKRLLEITGIDLHVPTYHTVDEALLDG